VTSEVLTPEQAVQKYLEVRERVKNLTVVGIAGPGDALANFEQTRKTLATIREADDKVTFCISTNGLLLPRYAQELLTLGVSHVTVTVNAVDDETGAKIYEYIEYDGVRYKGCEAAALLRSNQLEGIKLLTEKGVVVKVNIVLLKGVNDGQIEQIAETVKACGAKITNIMQLIPVEGTPFENMALVSNKEITAVRKQCEDILPQMYHCKQCRADAVGTLQEDLSVQFRGSGKKAPHEEEPEAVEEQKTFRFAIASKSGLIIDEHFGHSHEFYIYDSDGSDVRYMGKRTVGQQYCEGVISCGDRKPAAMGDILEAAGDCDAVLCMRIGTEPTRKLRESGKQVFMMFDRIESGVREAVKQLSKNKNPQIIIRRSL
jgi:MoaA/NifB/PqqE/SkfB family radical SAM enzyme